MPSKLNSLSRLGGSRSKKDQDEKLKKYRRRSIWLGSDTAEKLQRREESEAERSAGLSAIADIQSGMSRAEGPEAEAARGKLDAIAQLKANREKLRAQGDEEGALAMPAVRLDRSLADTTALARTSPEDVYSQGRKSLFAQGLAEQPEVAAFLNEQEGQRASQAKAEQMEKVAVAANSLADQLPEGEGNDLLRAIIRTAAETPGVMQKVLEGAYDQLGDIGKDVEATTQNIREEGVEQEGRIDLEDKKQEGGINLELLKQKGRIALEELRQKGKKDSSGKTAKEVKGLMDLEKAFDQLEGQHNNIWTGPVGGTIGKANITGVERAAFNSTRAYVLKTIARAFEGARMSDIDMTFYDKMVPKGTNTKKQFKEIRNSLSNLVDWRIKRFNETGDDPGPIPADKEDFKTIKTQNSAIEALKKKAASGDEEAKAYLRKKGVSW